MARSRRKTATQSNSTLTLADVTALKFTPHQNTTYKFRSVIFYTAAAATTGLVLAVTAPGTLAYGITIYETPTTFRHGISITSGAEVLALASSGGTGMMAVIEGVVAVASTLTPIQVRFRSEVDTSVVNILAGSYIEYEVMGGASQ